MTLQDAQLIIPLLFWTILLAFFFAKVEIHIEGEHGWAGSLPTWRVEEHWLLEIFWGGRPMTGYHAWIFSFITLVFHLAFFLEGKWSLQMEARVLASLMLFWMAEDFLWFVLNPAFGIRKFNRKDIHWHKKWFLLLPLDYWTFSILSIVFFIYSFS